jgi:hypothetical protein
VTGNGFAYVASVIDVFSAGSLWLDSLASVNICGEDLRRIRRSMEKRALPARRVLLPLRSAGGPDLRPAPR